MGADLKLVVPENEWSKDILQQYYNYRQDKRREIDPERDWPAAKDTLDYQVAVDELDRALLILEQLHRDLREAIDTDDFYALLGNVDERRTIYDDEIEDLIGILRESKKELIRIGDDKRKTEIRIETGPIALCEFALEEGYGVQLSE